jgi:hypothetical protein
MREVSESEPSLMAIRLESTAVPYERANPNAYGSTSGVKCRSKPPRSTKNRHAQRTDTALKKNAPFLFVLKLYDFFSMA